MERVFLYCIILKIIWVNAKRMMNFECHTEMEKYSPIEIGMVLYPNVQMAAVLGMTDLFVLAQKIAAQHNKGNVSELRVSHWELNESELAPRRIYDSGANINSTLQMLILPPSLEEPISSQRAKPYLGWLLEQHRAGVTLASVCAGAFLLGETGLLKGRTVTTHWLYEKKFLDRFSGVQLDLDQLIINSDDIWTAGGVMAWTDLGLRIVDRHFGAAVMIDTAKTLLIDLPGRQQRYYTAFAPRLAHGDEAILSVQHWLEENSMNDITLAEMAGYANMGERTFLRRFRNATGMTTTQYMQRLRIARARDMLQTTMASVEAIAWDIGYKDPGSFRKIFTRIVGLTPSDYRRRFKAD